MTPKERSRRRWERYKRAMIRCAPPGERKRERKRLNALPTPEGWPNPKPSRLAKRREATK